MKSVIYLAGGCFWGIQGYFDLLKGSIKSSVGYANSKVKNPSYELVCSGSSGAVEALELYYDDSILSLDEILRRFFSIIDPFALNYQGNDIGEQYRSGIYTQDSATLEFVLEFVAKYQISLKQKIVTEVMLLENFYPAESYHQKYLQKNPNGYCHIDISGALREI
ncbi:MULTISPECIES: peptide-methionine (S)-S-oxide reductase MsrA [Helicobacter]|uniref:Peptide methionine sulfoxide reductase MsrA n=1 Tax=Helicobacter ibis TaxID=2962633 RepID=A0ABT4VGY0_9HELI|nr:MULTISPECIES: peptide-methionine (S)-S-oxide reductase MsrA [Helicobacter]MDA3967168.1 peptide-methionine (S)-S-oxide reductase MsrA [Helicobacter sp. WB40]MDA3969296.1 peptide-methionine (S)-S-oxide reductase MsrA [Helicobacter ibis]